MEKVYDDIKDFKFYDSRAYKRIANHMQFVLYRKYWETVVFDDGTEGHYISVIREQHENECFDSVQTEYVDKQKIYLKNEFEKANKYFLSDRK